MDKRVSILKSEAYDAALLDQIIEQHFENLELDKLIQPGQKVLLKPNLVIRRAPEEATTTHPALVCAVARALKKRGVSDITLADSSGGVYNPAMLKSIYSGTGMQEAAEREGFRLNFDVSYRKVKAPDAVRCGEFHIIAPVLDADLIINLGKLKTHAMTGMSGAVKNMFGSVPGLMKPELHYRFPVMEEFGEMLVDLCELVRPQISILDGILCMEGNGPTGGTPKFGGLVLAGCNPHALDLAACRIMECNPATIPMLVSAQKRGLVPQETEALTILGEPLDAVVLKGFRQPDSKKEALLESFPKFMQNIVKKILTPVPSIVKSKCVGCGKCAESCPQKTIEIKNRKAKISYSKCIKCFCCQEMCPVRAIKIKTTKLIKL